MNKLQHYLRFSLFSIIILNAILFILYELIKAFPFNPIIELYTYYNSPLLQSVFLPFFLYKDIILYFSYLSILIAIYTLLKKKYSFFIISILVLAIFNIVYYYKGYIKYKISQYKNQTTIVLQDNIQKEYYAEGMIKKKTPYLKEKINGIEIEYYKNGQIKKETPYKDNKIDGIKKFYYENGQLEREILFKSDKTEGYYKAYYNTGELSAEYIKSSNMHVSYYKNGNIWSKTPYKDNKPNGLSITYYKNGNIQSKMELKQGLVSGISENYYKSGELKSISTIVKGRYLSTKGYYKSGKLKCESAFNESFKLIKNLHYNENGKSHESSLPCM